MPSPHLYLVDGSSYIFRAFHRLPPLTNKFGLNVGAVYGYTTMLWKLADSLNKADGPTHLAVILDASESTFRNQMYDQYKANRPPAAARAGAAISADPRRHPRLLHPLHRGEWGSKPTTSSPAIPRRRWRKGGASPSSPPTRI